MTAPVVRRMPGEEARAFLTALWPGDSPGYLAVTRFLRGVPMTSWFPGHDLDAVARHAVTCAGDADVYIGCCAHGQIPPTGRGDESTVSNVPGIWLDLDVAHARAHKSKNLPPTSAAALALLDGLPSPTLVVNSGHGLQVWWLYREPWTIETPGDAAAAKAAVARVQGYVRQRAKHHGWSVDNTSDLARILRVPGTRNHKTTPPPGVTIERETDARYNPSDFDVLPAADEAPAATPAADGLIGAHGEMRHQELVRRACRLFTSGLPELEVVAALRGLRDHATVTTDRAISDEELDGIVAWAKRFATPAAADPAAIAEADLSNWRDARPCEWIVPGLVQRGSVSLISARGGSGKSLVTLLLAAKLAAGSAGRWLDSFDLPADTLDLLYLDAECGSDRIARRLRELELGGALSADELDAALPRLHVLPAENLTAPGVILAALHELLKRWPGVRLVVIDPIRSFYPTTLDDENANILVGRVIDGLVAFAKQNQVAVLLIDHDSKDGRAARGASSKRDSAEFVWHLVAPDDLDDSYLELRPDKCRDPGGPGTVAFVRQGTGPDATGLYPVSFVRTDTRTPGKSSEQITARWAAIKNAVEAHYAQYQNGISLRRLVEQTGIARSTLHEHVNRMIACGLLYRPSPFGGIYPPTATPEAGP